MASLPPANFSPFPSPARQPIECTDAQSHRRDRATEEAVLRRLPAVDYKDAPEVMLDEMGPMHRSLKVFEQLFDVQHYEVVEDIGR